MANTYPDGANFVCPDCSHEWPMVAEAEAADDNIVRDSNGTPLADGDAVVLIKDLKVKGSSLALKRGKVFKNIRLTSKNDEIECREGKTTLVLKTCFLKKA